MHIIFNFLIHIISTSNCCHFISSPKNKQHQLEAAIGISTLNIHLLGDSDEPDATSSPALLHSSASARSIGCHSLRHVLAAEVLDKQPISDKINPFVIAVQL